ncbi:MAG: ABC transporter permease [Mesorhizobium sp.]
MSGGLPLRIFTALVFAFLMLPIVSVVVSSFASSPVLYFPPSGFTLHWYRNVNAEFTHALVVSLIVAAGTTAVAVVIGTCAALALVRGSFPGKRIMGVLFMSPLSVSTVVIGVAAFQYTITLWDLFGVQLGGTLVGLILGQAAFTIPFVIRAAIAGQAHFDMSIEEAALNLGATPLQTFFYITLPLILPGIVSGGIFAFIMSFDDVPVALFLGGGDATTLPVKIYTSVEFNFDADVMAVGTIVIAGSLACMALLDRLVGLGTLFGAEHKN